MVDKLAPHPQEALLRQNESRTADALEDLCKKTVKALRAHDRTKALVGFTNLQVTAGAGRNAMQIAINEQMEATRG